MALRVQTNSKMFTDLDCCSVFIGLRFDELIDKTNVQGQPDALRRLDRLSRDCGDFPGASFEALQLIRK